MNKIVSGVMLSLFCICGAFAASLCAKDDVVVIALDPSINGSSSTYENSTGVWKAVFSYGDISGVSACLTTFGSSMGTENTSIDAVGGEALGQYCWCKMLHPMESAWVFDYDLGSLSNCRSNCAYTCSYVRTDFSLRGGMFGSVGK